MTTFFETLQEEILLSIIIPVYNVEKYVLRCLESCTVQQMNSKYKYEVICVDDGSTDRSLEIVQEYAAKHDLVKVIHKSNGGVSSARNCGMSVAQGRYLWFVDADDWIAEGSIGAIGDSLQNIAGGGKPDCVLFASRQVTEYENIVIHRIHDAKLVSGGYETTKTSYSNSVCCRWFSTELIKDNGFLFEEDMKYAEDTLFLAKAKMKCKNQLVIEDALYYYFQRSASAMHGINANEHVFCMLRLAIEYRSMQMYSPESKVRNRMQHAYTRAMQALCRDLCLYCDDRKTVREILKLLKERRLYPFGIDWSNFRIDRKQSLKNDILNWMFALISIEPIFWLQFLICGKLFSSKRTDQEFDIDRLNSLLTK